MYIDCIYSSCIQSFVQHDVLTGGVVTKLFTGQLLSTYMFMCIFVKRSKKLVSSLLTLGTYIGNIMGEILFLNFGAEFQY